MEALEDHQRAVDGQPALHGAHGLAAGYGRQNGPGAAQLQEFRRGVLGLTVDPALTRPTDAPAFASCWPRAIPTVWHPIFLAYWTAR